MQGTGRDPTGRAQGCRGTGWGLRERCPREQHTEEEERVEGTHRQSPRAQHGTGDAVQGSRGVLGVGGNKEGCWGSRGTLWGSPAGTGLRRVMGAEGSEAGAGTTAAQRDPRAGRGDRGDWDDQGCSGGSLGVVILAKW